MELVSKNGGYVQFIEKTSSCSKNWLLDANFFINVQLIQQKCNYIYNELGFFSHNVGNNASARYIKKIN
jgi:hypothetical protein